MLSVLQNSRIATLIGQVERGEDVDLNRVLTLQALDAAKVSEDFVIDALVAERQADDRTIAELSGN